MNRPMNQSKRGWNRGNILVRPAGFRTVPKSAQAVRFLGRLQLWNRLRSPGCGGRLPILAMDGCRQPAVDQSGENGSDQGGDPKEPELD